MNLGWIHASDGTPRLDVFSVLSVDKGRVKLEVAPHCPLSLPEGNVERVVINRRRKEF